MALLTGATSGIGWELAHQLSAQKIPLIVTGRDQKKLFQLEKKLGCFSFRADLSLEEGRKKVMEVILEKRPTLMINNAGMALYGNFLSHSLSEQMKLIHVNADAIIELSYIAGKTLKSHGKKGVILNISSIAGEFPCPGMATYSAAKALVTNFSKSLDYELRSDGIRVLVTILGQVKTNFAKRASKNKSFRRQEPAISAKLAAELIFRQIRKRKGVRIIPHYYSVLLPIALSMPSQWICKKIFRSINNRIG